MLKVLACSSILLYFCPVMRRGKARAGSTGKYMVVVVVVVTGNCC